MIDTIYFFASKKDICNIFYKIEREFEIKYCMTRADKKAGETGMPKMEFDTIEEIADDCHAAHMIQPFYLIAPKTEVMKSYQQALKDRDDIERYCMDYTENRNSVMLKGMQQHKDLTHDYYVHIDRKLETEFSGMLFKRIVREVKQNCVRIKYNTPVYIGKELYKGRGELVFCGERSKCFTVTETDEAKEWFRNPKVRAFADQTFKEQISFLQDVFCGKKLKDFERERKEFSEDYQIYRVAMSQPWKIKDLTFFRELFALFDDTVLVDDAFSPITAMEGLCEASVYAASAHKPDGIRILLEHLSWIPEKGYHCGCEGIVRLLLKKKYFEIFKMSMEDVTEDTKLLIKKILEGLTDKKTANQRKELLDCSKCSAHERSRTSNPYALADELHQRTNDFSGSMRKKVAP